MFKFAAEDQSDFSVQARLARLGDACAVVRP
jgi:hypothetical protein